MNPETGRLYTPPEVEAMRASEREKLVPISPQELAVVFPMTLAQRVAWAKKRKLRNANKRARKARREGRKR